MEIMEENNCAKIIEDNVQSFGQRLAEFIEQIGMNKKKFADEIKMSPQSISNYCAGTNQPKPRFLEILVQRFGANREWLMTGSGPMFAADLECQPKRQGPSGQTQDEQLVELQRRLAEQILAGAEMRDRHSRWLHRTLAAIAKTAKAYGMTTDQHQAIMDAVLDPDEAMAKLAELEAATVHQSAVGD